MVCRHCLRPAWRIAPFVILLPHLLLSLVLATTHRPPSNTPTLPYTPTPPPTTHLHTHNNFHQLLPERTGQCAAVAPLDATSSDNLTPEKLEGECQTCGVNEGHCDRRGKTCPTFSEVLCSKEERREETIRRVTLRYCPHMTLRSVMCDQQVESVTNTSQPGCSTVARHLQEMDNLVGRVLHQHQALISKYNCDHPYSITQTCSACKVRSHTSLTLSSITL
nr:uncharacterized protein LOC128693398 [Cherax quadricarinatus]